MPVAERPAGASGLPRLAGERRVILRRMNGGTTKQVASGLTGEPATSILAGTRRRSGRHAARRIVAGRPLARSAIRRRRCPRRRGRHTVLHAHAQSCLDGATGAGRARPRSTPPGTRTASTSRSPPGCPSRCRRHRARHGWALRDAWWPRPWRGPGAVADRLAAEIAAPAAGAVRDRRPRRLQRSRCRTCCGRIHAVVGGLMYAENFFIVLYDEHPRERALPVLRRPARPLRRRTRRSRSPVEDDAQQPDRGAAAPRPAAARAVGASCGARWACRGRRRPTARTARTGWACRCGATAASAARSWCRATTIPPVSATRTARCSNTSPSTSRPRSTAGTPACDLERRVYERTLELQQANLRAAGGNRRAPARREAAARAVPDHRTVGDHRQPGALLCRRACRGRRAAVRAQLLHRAADAGRRADRVPVLRRRTRHQPRHPHSWPRA